MTEPRESMPEDEEEIPTLEQIERVIQQSVLTDYPNPARAGCLDLARITAIAKQRLPHKDPQWGHVSHCSPCYREFLDHRRNFKAALRRKALRRQLMVW